LSARFGHLSPLNVSHSYYMFLDAIQTQPLPTKSGTLSLIDQEGYVNVVGLTYFLLFLVAHMHVTVLGGAFMPLTFIDKDTNLLSTDDFYDNIIGVKGVHDTDKAGGNKKAVPTLMAIRLMAKGIAKRFHDIVRGATEKSRAATGRYPDANQLCVTLYDRTSKTTQLAVPLSSNLYVELVHGIPTFRMISCECPDLDNHLATCPCEMNGISCTSFCKCGYVERTTTDDFNDQLVTDTPTIQIQRILPPSKILQADVAAAPADENNASAVVAAVVAVVAVVVALKDLGDDDHADNNESEESSEVSGDDDREDDEENHRGQDTDEEDEEKDEEEGEEGDETTDSDKDNLDDEEEDDDNSSTVQDRPE
jgi:hypothetical protein